MTIEVEGEVNEHGMVIDFKDIKRILKPLVDAWDHATLVAAYDTDLKKAVELLGSKYYELPYDSTSENMCQYAVEFFLKNAGDVLVSQKITRARVRIQETETCYAELEVPIHTAIQQGDGHASQLQAAL